MIPESLQKSLIDYIENGKKPGSCLMAILENKLVESFLTSDDDTSERMKDIVFYLYNTAPSNCWGSPEKVSSWMQKGGWHGSFRKDLTTTNNLL